MCNSEIPAIPVAACDRVPAPYKPEVVELAGTPITLFTREAPAVLLSKVSTTSGPVDELSLSLKLHRMKVVMYHYFQLHLKQKVLY